ncbi:MAG: hypothetical protein ACRENE_33435, partial [Polyangiaceae bacterium]
SGSWSGGGSDAGGCAPDLALEGPAVSVMGGGSGSPPASTGGTITQGTYVLTAATIYPAPAGTTLATVQTTLLLSGSQFEEMDASNGAPPSTSSGRWVTAGSTMGLLASCPSMTMYSWSYSASPGTLTLTVPPMTGSTATLVETFSLQ